MLWGRRIWPGVALGALLANSWTRVPFYGVVGITLGNTLEALAGAFLLERVAAFRPSLERVRDVVALAFAGAFGAHRSPRPSSLLVGRRDLGRARFGCVSSAPGGSATWAAT